MAQNYECALLLHPDLNEDQVQSYLEHFSKEITDRNGEVVHTQVWGKRPLEYTIAREDHAIYAFLYFRMESAGDLVEEFERQVRIQDELLREMTVKVPELKIKEAPTSESRFTESARLSASSRRGGRPGGRPSSRPPRESAPAPKPGESSDTESTGTESTGTESSGTESSEAQPEKTETTDA